MISARYLPAIAILLALAGVPTVLHSYMGSTVDDGRTLSGVPNRLNGLDAVPGSHSVAWVEQLYGTSDFIERHYGAALTLFVARSYDAKSLYHHPENGIGHGDSYDRAVVARSPQRMEVPMFILDNGRDRRSAYALLYDGQFIEDPIRFQLRNALVLLAKPKALTTLFFVRGKSTSTKTVSGGDVDSLLLAAVDAYMAQARSGSK